MKTSLGMCFRHTFNAANVQNYAVNFSDDMKRLVHLKYCIKESLRLFPPVCAVGRVLDQDTDITGYGMPKGTSVVANIYAIHRHPDFWENPDVMLHMPRVVLKCSDFV